MLHALGVMLTRELERSAFYRDRVPAAGQAGLGLRLRLLRLDLLPRGFAFRRPADYPADRRRRPGATRQIPALMLLLVGLVWLYQFAYESRLRGRCLATSGVRVTLAVGMVLYLCLCSSGGGTFIYFQF